MSRGLFCFWEVEEREEGGGGRGKRMLERIVLAVEVCGQIETHPDEDLLLVGYVRPDEPSVGYGLRVCRGDGELEGDFELPWGLSILAGCSEKCEVQMVYDRVGGGKVVLSPASVVLEVRAEVVSFSELFIPFRVRFSAPIFFPKDVGSEETQIYVPCFPPLNENPTIKEKQSIFAVALPYNNDKIVLLTGNIQERTLHVAPKIVVEFFSPDPPTTPSIVTSPTI